MYYWQTKGCVPPNTPHFTLANSYTNTTAISQTLQTNSHF
jgi:hypothetical protein